jgi:hypothetical protein
MTAHEFVPGAECQAGATRRVATRVTPAAPQETGLDGRGGGPTQREMVAASLLLGDATERHACYARRVPGAPRHA